jgi:PAS domain S-box-containing protein
MPVPSIMTQGQTAVYPASQAGQAEPQHSSVLEARWIAGPLRLGLLLTAVVSQTAFFADACSRTGKGSLAGGLIHPPGSYGLFVLTASILALGVSLTPLFERFWKPITLDFCLAVLAGWTWMSVWNNQQGQLFAVVLALTGVCSFVPWGRRWQMGLTAAGIVAAALNTALVDSPAPGLGYLWGALLVVCAVASYCSGRIARWRDLTADAEARLRADVARGEMAQKRLREGQANLRKIFEACPDIICVNSLIDRRYIDVNQKFSATGYSKFEALGGSLETLGIWANPAQLRTFMNELEAEAVVHNMEADFRFKDGAVRPCLVSGAMVDLDCEPCAVTFATEITRLKRTERELIAAREAAVGASRAKSEFLCNMSYDLRTPMNAILGMADLLGEGSLTAEQRHCVDAMASNGNSLLNLINSILDLAKVETGKMQLEETEFDLEELVEQTLQTLSARAHGKGLELAAQMAPDVPSRLFGDPARLRQVLISLIENAIKFTQSGEVVLTVENPAESDANEEGSACRPIRFSIRDTGIGIPHEKLKAITGASTEDDYSGARKYGGSGLGIAIARRLVDLMGGSLVAKSQVGWGSTFSFLARFKAAPEPRVRLVDPNLSGLRVLLVDDNFTSRSIIRDNLTALGARVVEAASGKKALAKSDRARRDAEPYDLVLVDSGLPDVDGLQVAELLARDSDGPNAIIPMLTSEKPDAMLARLHAIGLDDYLVKPLKRTELIQKIAAVTGRSSRKPSPEARSKLIKLVADDRGEPTGFSKTMPA